MDKLIQNFSIKSLSDFFKNNANLKPQHEDLAYILEDKDFPDFSELTRIGNVEFKNSDELIVFSCKYNGILSERSSKKKQFEIAKLVLKEDFKDGAIFVFMMMQENLDFHLSEETGTEKQIRNILLGSVLPILYLQKTPIKPSNRELGTVHSRIWTVFKMLFRLKN